MNFKEALIAHLSGEMVEANYNRGGWVDFAKDFSRIPLEALKPFVDAQGYEFRLAPRTITVNGVEVPAPESESMADGRLYFVAAPNVDLWAFASSWSGSGADNEWLQRGLIYINQDDAIARAKAMMLFSK